MKIADGWILTVDFWCRKQPLYLPTVPQPLPNFIFDCFARLPPPHSFSCECFQSFKGSYPSILRLYQAKFSTHPSSNKSIHFEHKKTRCHNSLMWHIHLIIVHNYEALCRRLCVGGHLLAIAALKRVIKEPGFYLWLWEETHDCVVVVWILAPEIRLLCLFVWKDLKWTK